MLHEPVVIFDTEATNNARPHLMIDENGLVTFDKFKPYRNGSEIIYYQLDKEKEKLLIDTITERMHEIGVEPGNKNKTISFRKDGFPTYYGKPIKYFINRSLRAALQNYTYGLTLLYPDCTFDRLLYFIKYEMDYRSFILKTGEWSPSEYILTVDKPSFRRETGNTNNKTFDFIDILMTTRSNDANKEKVLANRNEINRKAIEAIEKDRSFKKFGVPVGVLKMYSFSIINHGMLSISFCLKDELLMKGDN